MSDGTEPVEQSATWKPAMLRLIHDELTAFEAKHQLGREQTARLDEIIDLAGRQASRGPGYRRMYERALRVQRAKMTAATRSTRRGHRDVRNPDFFQGGREVLGGLPSARRGH